MFHHTYVSRIRKQETVESPCGHQSRLLLIALNTHSRKLHYGKLQTNAKQVRLKRCTIKKDFSYSKNIRLLLYY